MNFARAAWRILSVLPLALLSPLFLAVTALALAICDAISALIPKRFAESRRATAAASIVIPNWNGRELLGKYLPSVLAAVERQPGTEVLVVDNGSTDGSTEFLRERFPQVR